MNRRMGHPLDRPPPSRRQKAPNRRPRPGPRPDPRWRRTSPETDREALVALYNATGGPNWERNDNWLSSAPVGEWRGVYVDAEGRVAELYLSSNQLSGEMPPELGNLASLEGLYLGWNELSGCVPSSLSGRLNLDYSDLGNLRFCP